MITVVVYLYSPCIPFTNAYYGVFGL